MSLFLLKIKEFGSNKKNNTVIKIGLVIISVAVLSIGIVFASYSDNVNKGLADNLIRLHVLANSDSVEDQALKREVRDAVLNYMKEELKASRDIEQTKYIINKNMGKIEELAVSEITAHGRNYTVKTMLGSYPFPTRSYGDITLPAGYYQALRIVIGEGAGANWWCVLFPPLCFVDVTHGAIPDSVKQNLKKALTNEEYRVIAAAESDEDIPVKIRFKVVELFQNSRIKFTGMVNRLFWKLKLRDGS